MYKCAEDPAPLVGLYVSCLDECPAAMPSMARCPDWWDKFRGFDDWG